MAFAEVASGIPDPCDLPGASLSPVCQLKDAATDALGGIAGTALEEIANAVVGAVKELLGAVLDFLSAPVQPRLNERWFEGSFDRVVSVSATFAAVFFILGVARGIARGSLTELGRVVGFTVGAFATAGVALTLTQSFIALVDVATAQVAAGTPNDMAATFASMLAPLAALTVTGPGGALLAMLFGLMVAMGAFAVYVELFIRNVMIHVIVYFLPLMLVGTIWGPTRRWARRAIEFLAVLILSKFVLYAVIALGWTAVTSFDDQKLSTSWASVVTGIVLLCVAAYLPWLLFKLLPFMEMHVHAAMNRRDARAVAMAPLAPVSASVRTAQLNLRRAASLTGGGAATPVLLGASAVNGANGGPRGLVGVSPGRPAAHLGASAHAQQLPQAANGQHTAIKPVPLPPQPRRPDGGEQT